MAQKHKKLLWLERKITENNYKNAAFQWYGSNARLDSLFRMHANFLLRLISASIQGQYRRNMQVHLILRMPRPAAELVEQHMAQLPAFHEGISDVSLRPRQIQGVIPWRLGQLALDSPILRLHQTPATCGFSLCIQFMLTNNLRI